MARALVGGPSPSEIRCSLLTLFTMVVHFVRRNVVALAVGYILDQDMMNDMVQAICPEFAKAHGMSVGLSLAMHLSDIGHELFLIHEGEHAGSGLFVNDYPHSFYKGPHPIVEGFAAETHQVWWERFGRCVSTDKV